MYIGLPSSELLQLFLTLMLLFTGIWASLPHRANFTYLNSVPQDFSLPYEKLKFSNIFSYEWLCEMYKCLSAWQWCCFCSVLLALFSIFYRLIWESNLPAFMLWLSFYLSKRKTFELLFPWKSLSDLAKARCVIRAFIRLLALELTFFCLLQLIHFSVDAHPEASLMPLLCS